MPEKLPASSASEASSDRDESSASKPPMALVTHPRRGISPVWIVPIVAALIGLWLVWHHYSSLGPLVEVRFETAEGVVAGKTPVQCRSVNVGVVESVRLSDDLKSVVTHLRINSDEATLLKKDTRFWVERPRFGGSGISGLGTLVSGSFIELDPGVSPDAASQFSGLENPPVTPLGVPGVHVTLVSDIAGSLTTGSPVYFKGYKVGRIESRDFNIAKKRIEFGAFIQGEFGKLVTERTRFWNVSGIDLDVSSAGVRLRTGTLESLIAGGVAFDSDNDPQIGPHIREGEIFPLYASKDVTNEVTLNPRLTYLLLFKDSVRGLNIDAPVEFRGIQVGNVTDISFDYLPDDIEHRVPVLIKIDPSLIFNLPANDPTNGAAAVAQSISQGLRATLRTGSLITGQLYVDLDIQEHPVPVDIATIGSYNIIPTISSGLNQLQEKLASFLDKVQALPLNETVKNANSALANISDTAGEAKTAVADLKKATASLDRILSSESTQALPSESRATLISLRQTLTGFDKSSMVYRDLATTIQELNETLRSIDSLANTLERKPSSLIWGNPKGTVSPPRAKP